MRLVRDQTALNPQHHPLDCEHVGSLCRAGWIPRAAARLARAEQAKAAPQFGQPRALCTRRSISLGRYIDRGDKGVGPTGFVKNSGAT